MSKVIRVFVEKKKGFDVEANHVMSDLRENLGMKAIKEVRVINRYDVEGLTDEQMLQAKPIVFSEPNVDEVVDDTMTFDDKYKVFAMEYLPGQYDQRADSASQCAQLLTQGEKPKVVSAKVIAVAGDISSDDFEKIKQYLINPVESRIASFEKPQSLDLTSATPEDIKTIEGFISFDADQMKEYYGSMGFAMTIDDLVFCQTYFRDEEKRDPFVTELKVIDTYWSDHCRHTTFQTELTKIEIEEGELSAAIEDGLKAYFAARDEVYGEREKSVCLMDMAVMGTKLLRKRGLVDDLDVSEEINACSIEVPVVINGETQTWLVQFKNETHNHPTEIEPFGGAATCLGGAIRDPLSGRSYVYQAMRVTGSGDPRVAFEDTMEGKLPARKITTGAASGYSSYGNQIGLATGQVTEFYDKGYAAKRLEIGAVIAASPKENVVREVPQDGDLIVLLGGRTGRDGCGGATGSSKAHTLDSIETCGAEVQKGNPPTERKIQRLFRNAQVAKLIKRCNDFGAGGVCVAIGELADGLTIDLDAVPKKYDGLDGTELAISESQERMAVVLKPDDVASFIAHADKENLEANVVAVVTEVNRLKMKWRNNTIVNLSRDFLNTNGVVQHANSYIKAPKANDDYRTAVPKELKDMSIAKAFEENLTRLEVCSQKGLSERFDSSIGAGTVLMPFAGKYQLSPEEAMVAKIPLEHGTTDDATVMSFGFIPAIGSWSPFHGAAYAVVESLSRILAVGSDPKKARLTFQEYFERLHNDPTRWGKPTAALLGAFLAQEKMGTPAIGGKDSMSGSFEDLDVPPTLVSFAVGMTKASKTISATFNNTDTKVYLVPLPTDESTLLPNWDKLNKMYSAILELMNEGKVTACSTVHEGGAAASIAKMCFGNKIGFSFNNDLTKKQLFAPICGSIIIECDDVSSLEEFDVVKLGKTTDKKHIKIDGEKLDISDLAKKWLGVLENVFPNKAKCDKEMQEVKLYTEKSILAPAIKVAKPKVFIPAFPGTNCEIDTARAFEQAGADTDILIVRNLSQSAIEETIDEMVKRINDSQIVMFPGGFSGGDEPDGSGKFIATTFRNPRIKEAIDELLNNRDGLMLGICNGFQALIKLGLVPFGEIKEISKDDPTLTFNTIGRHISRMAYTKISSVKSPWLNMVNAGDVFSVPVSHGEGRFVANDEVVKKLIANGQIATQYCDANGNVDMDIKWNPNGSVCAIEGITSPDGRILGKMGHSERKGDNLYKNVPGDKDQFIFNSGVKYFK